MRACAGAIEGQWEGQKGDPYEGTVCELEFLCMKKRVSGAVCLCVLNRTDSCYPKENGL